MRRVVKRALSCGELPPMFAIALSMTLSYPCVVGLSESIISEIEYPTFGAMAMVIVIVTSITIGYQSGDETAKLSPKGVDEDGQTG